MVCGAITVLGLCGPGGIRCREKSSWGFAGVAVSRKAGRVVLGGVRLASKSVVRPGWFRGRWGTGAKEEAVGKKTDTAKVVAGKW